MTQSNFQPTLSLSDTQIAQFHEQGFLAIDAITTPQEIKMLREVYDRIFAERAGRESGDQFDLGGSDEDGKIAVLPQILNPSKYAPELRDTQLRVNAAHITQQLLGADTGTGGDHAIFKPARYGAPTPWHQDEAYWNPAMNYNAISVWIPLQEATLENGCLQFVPGSHRSEIVEHQPIGNDPRIHGLETVAPIDQSRVVACPLPAGGATLHLNRTLHYAGPNHSDVPRRAYIIGFGTPPQAGDSTRRFPWNERKTTARDERAKQANQN